VDEDTKTPFSERDVPMGRVLAHYLREWHKETPYAKLTDFVFPSMRNSGRSPICSSVFCRVHLRPAAKKAGVVIPDGHRWGLHNLRHSLSNWLVNKAKENPKTVQGILGHSRIQTTLDLYTSETLIEPLTNPRPVPWVHAIVSASAAAKQRPWVPCARKPAPQSATISRAAFPASEAFRPAPPKEREQCTRLWAAFVGCAARPLFFHFALFRVDAASPRLGRSLGLMRRCRAKR